MPIANLETIAHVNYNTVRPRPIDPAFLFDLVKVRRLVDEATNLAVLAASDTSSAVLANVDGTLRYFSSPGPSGSGNGIKISRERKFRMREQASQKLARAYRLDEIACSVATMQKASPLEDIGKAILHRNPEDPDAKYVHFFQEKIPSRQLAESTSLCPLSEVIADRPNEPEVLRTRAMIKMLKKDYGGAAQDLTHALNAHRFHRQPSHAGDQGDLQLQDQQRFSKRRPQDIILAEKDQPCSLESQMLFQRGAAHLSMACQHVLDSLPPDTSQTDRNKEHGAIRTDAAAEALNEQMKSPEPTEPVDSTRAELRRKVKILAKRALRDYMDFLTGFEYTPNLPHQYGKEFVERVDMAIDGSRHARCPDRVATPPTQTHPVCSLAALFASTPVQGLPPYPPPELVANGQHSIPHHSTSSQSITDHPLLSDALHSMLLCHCLIQTSPKELQRHAYMVARLVSLSDGYPIFPGSRPPSRSDWMQILYQTNNWLNLSSTWEILCTPLPITAFDIPEDLVDKSDHRERAAAAAAAGVHPASSKVVAKDLRREGVREQALLDTLEDQGVMDEASSRASTTARQRGAEEGRDALAPDRKMSGGADSNMGHNQSRPTLNPSSARSSGEGGGHSPVLTERAACIAQWVRDAPVVTGTTRRRRKVKKTSTLKCAQAAIAELSVDTTQDA